MTEGFLGHIDGSNVEVQIEVHCWGECAQGFFKRFLHQYVNHSRHKLTKNVSSATTDLRNGEAGRWPYSRQAGEIAMAMVMTEKRYRLPTDSRLSSTVAARIGDKVSLGLFVEGN